MADVIEDARTDGLRGFGFWGVEWHDRENLWRSSLSIHRDGGT